KDLMLEFAERMPARKALIDRFVYGKQPTLRQMELDAGTTPLDTLWGFYFATGSREPIMRIISVLAWAKDQNNVERLTIGSMAKLSLATNASRDKELLDTLSPRSTTRTKIRASCCRRSSTRPRRSSSPACARMRWRQSTSSKRRAQPPPVAISGGEWLAKRRWLWAAWSPAPWARWKSAFPAWSAALCRVPRSSG